MARMEMELQPNFFQVYRLCLGKVAKTLIMVYSIIENSFDVFLFVFYKYFMFVKSTSF